MAKSNRAINPSIFKDGQTEMHTRTFWKQTHSWGITVLLRVFSAVGESCPEAPTSADLSPCGNWIALCEGPTVIYLLLSLWGFLLLLFFETGSLNVILAARKLTV